MCADAAIHETDGHNPHAHIMLTVRPLSENGTWPYKTKKECVIMKNVLILSGSPRRNGNSDLLCDAFFRGAEDAGNQVEKIFVRDKKIG